jgi:glycosyltransferase involved in cell wall biosynthesis
MTGRRLRILAVEPYYGGSHRAVLDGLVERIDAEWTLRTLPARKWKWRMRGAAIVIAASLREEYAASGLDTTGPLYDLVFASTFVNLAELYGLAGPALAGVPSVLYLHENQFVYPNRHEAEWDFQFPLTNITSALTADTCIFNSEWTRETLLREVGPFLKQFPDHRPTGVAEMIAAKSHVLAPPFDPAPFDEFVCARGPRLRIVWPHRWEHDKNPDSFFEAVRALAAEGLDFEVAVAGQAFSDRPSSFDAARGLLGDRLVHIGEPENRGAYARLLRSSDIAVSTADNEFFGLAMIEAAYCGCYPLVPNRLAYQGIYPQEMRYDGAEQLTAHLRELVLNRPAPGQAGELAAAYTFDMLVPAFERLFRATGGEE